MARSRRPLAEAALRFDLSPRVRRGWPLRLRGSRSRRPAYNVGQTLALARRAAAEPRRASWSSRNSACRRTRTKTCSSRTRCSTRRWARSSRWSTASRELAARAGRRAAAARRRPAVQLRRRGAPRPRSRRGAEELPAQLPRVLREAAVRAGRAGAVATSIRLLGQDVPFGAACCSRRSTSPGFVLHLEICEDLWVPLPPSTLGVARRRDGDRQPLGQRHHRRQGRLPPPALRLAVGEVRGRLSLLGRGPRRVDDRPRLGRPRAGLRERRAARRVAALPAASPAWSRPTSTSITCARSARGSRASATACRRTPRRCAGFRRIEFELDAAARPRAARAPRRTLPLRAGRPARLDERCAEVYDIQVEGLMKRLAATRPRARW